jgi:hypothetical protein
MSTTKLSIINYFLSEIFFTFKLLYFIGWKYYLSVIVIIWESTWLVILVKLSSPIISPVKNKDFIILVIWTPPNSVCVDDSTVVRGDK